MKNKIFLGAILSSFCALAFYMTSINHMKTQTLEIYGNSTAKVAQKSKMKEGTKQTHDVELTYAGQEVSVTETATSFVNDRQKVTVSLEENSK